MIVIGHYDSGCFPQPAGLEVNLIRHTAAKRLVRTNAVVAAEVSCQSGPCIGDGVVCPQVDLFVFDAAPQPLDEHVVEPAALAIHADMHTGVLEWVGEGAAGKLAALVGVKYLRRPEAPQGLVQRFHAEVRGQGVGEPPRQFPAAVPVHDRDPVQEATSHGTQ